MHYQVKKESPIGCVLITKKTREQIEDEYPEAIKSLDGFWGEWATRFMDERNRRVDIRITKIK